MPSTTLSSTAATRRRKRLLGGDLGEFVIGLAAYESLHNANLEVWYGQGSRKVELSYQDVAKMLFYHPLWSGPTKIAFSYPTDKTRSRAPSSTRRYRWWGMTP